MTKPSATKGTLAAAKQSFFVYVVDNNTNEIKRLAFNGDIQVGMPGNPAETNLMGRLSLNPTSYYATGENDGVITTTSDDTIIAVNLVDQPSSNEINVVLPPDPRDGQVHFIKDITGTASGSAHIVLAPSPLSGNGIMIDNQGTQTISDNYGALGVFWLLGNWHVFTKV